MRQLIAAALVCMYATVAHAQDRRITIVTPAAAGANADAVLRLLAPELGKKIGATFVIENMPAANGSAAMVHAAKAAPGSTLIFSNNGQHVIVPAMRKAAGQPLGYSNESFVPIAGIVDTPFIVLAHEKLDVKSFRDLMTAASVGRESLICGAGNPTGAMFCGLLRTRSGGSVPHVPHQGEPSALTSLAGGFVTVVAATASGAVGIVEGGTVRPLGTLGSVRSSRFPRIAILAEEGCTECPLLTSWSGMFAPVGTSPDLIDQVARALRELLDDLAIHERIAQRGATPRYMTDTELSQRIQTELPATEAFFVSSGVRF